MKLDVVGDRHVLHILQNNHFVLKQYKKVGPSHEYTRYLVVVEAMTRLSAMMPRLFEAFSPFYQEASLQYGQIMPDESHTIEYKACGRPDRFRQKELINTIVGFLNAPLLGFDDGDDALLHRISYGVEDDLRVRGILVDTVTRDQMRMNVNAQLNRITPRHKFGAAVDFIPVLDTPDGKPRYVMTVVVQKRRGEEIIFSVTKNTEDIVIRIGPSNYRLGKCTG